MKSARGATASKAEVGHQRAGVPIGHHRHQVVPRPTQERHLLRPPVDLDLWHGAGFEALGEDEIHPPEIQMGEGFQRQPPAVSRTTNVVSGDRRATARAPACRCRHESLPGTSTVHGAVVVVLDGSDSADRGR